MERALIFKEKMHQEAKRRAERLKEFTDAIYLKMKALEESLNHIRLQVEEKMTAMEGATCCGDE